MASEDDIWSKCIRDDDALIEKGDSGAILLYR